MRIVGAVTICLVDGVGIDLCAAVRFREPAEELGILARRLSGEDECFAVGLLRCLCVSIAEIPCDRIAIGGKLCVERLCRCDGHGIVQTATRSGGVPALERMTSLDRRARRGGCRRIRLACRGDAGLAINRAAICACIPCNCQRNGRTAIVALSIAVCIYMIGAFFTGSLTNRAGFRALVLRFAVRHPRAIGIAVIGVVIG